MAKRPEAVARRSVAWTPMYQMVRQGMGANRIIDTLRQYALGYNRQEMLQDIRLIKSGIEVWRLWQRPKEGDVIDLGAAPVREVRIPTRYQVAAVVEMWDARGRYAGARVMALQTDTRVYEWSKLRGEIESLALASMYEYTGEVYRVRAVALYEPWTRAGGGQR